MHCIEIFYVVVGPESAPCQPGMFVYIDLSKLSNLGTYQEIGNGYNETATERNFISKILFSFMLHSQIRIEQKSTFEMLTSHTRSRLTLQNIKLKSNIVQRGFTQSVK